MLEFNATFIVAMLSFIVFIIIMNAIFYKPILSVIEKRKDFIDSNYIDAKNSKDQAELILSNKEKRLEETAKTSKKIILEKTADAEEKSKKLINTAKLQYKEKIDDAKENLKIQKKSVDMNKSIEDIAESISKKLLGEISG